MTAEIIRNSTESGQSGLKKLWKKLRGQDPNITKDIVRNREQLTVIIPGNGNRYTIRGLPSGKGFQINSLMVKNMQTVPPPQTFSLDINGHVSLDEESTYIIIRAR